MTGKDFVPTATFKKFPSIKGITNEGVATLKWKKDTKQKIEKRLEEIKGECMNERAFLLCLSIKRRLLLDELLESLK